MNKDQAIREILEIVMQSECELQSTKGQLLFISEAANLIETATIRAYKKGREDGVAVGVAAGRAQVESEIDADIAADRAQSLKEFIAEDKVETVTDTDISFTEVPES